MLTIEVSKSRTFLTDYKSRIIEIKSTRYSCLFFVTVENGGQYIQPKSFKQCGIHLPWVHLTFYVKPTGYVMHHQKFNIQQLYVLPTLYLYILYLSENKQRLVPLKA